MTWQSDIQLITDIGRILYGEHWQSPMAELLGVSRRTLDRWRQGAGVDRSPPALGRRQKGYYGVPDRETLQPILRKALMKYQRETGREVKRMLEKIDA